MPKKKLTKSQRKFLADADKFLHRPYVAGGTISQETLSTLEDQLPPPVDSLANSYVGFGSATTELSNDDIANIHFITKLPQFASLRRLLILNIRDWYQEAGRTLEMADAKLYARLASFLESELQHLETIGTRGDVREGTDAYDSDVSEPEPPFAHDEEIITKAPH